MNVTLTAGTAGQRADQFLAAALDGLTRSAAQKLLEEGRVLRGGKALKKNDRLQPGDVLTLCIPDPSPVEILPQEIPLDVVYEDGDVIVVNKPVGLVVHPGPPRRHPGQRPALPLRPEPVRHQRPAPAGDRPPDRPGHQRPHHRRQERHGPPGPGPAAPGPQPLPGVRGGGGGQLSGGPGHDLPPHRPPPHRPEEDGGEPPQRPARGDPLDRPGPGYTHLQCRLETGRTHQIRVHMAALGHPVLGDPVYGGVRKGFPELAGQCLHARRLTFRHPRTGERITLSCPLPDYFQAVLTRCARLV